MQCPTVSQQLSLYRRASRGEGVPVLLFSRGGIHTRSMVGRAAMISGTAVASALTDLWGRKGYHSPHTQPALKGEKLTSEANILVEKRPSNESMEQAQCLLLC